MLRYAQLAALHGVEAPPKSGPPVTSVSQPEDRREPEYSPVTAPKRPEFQLDLFGPGKNVPNVTCAGACREKRKKTFSSYPSSSVLARARVTVGPGGPVALVTEAERWLQVPARLPQRIAALIQAWRVIDADRASWETRTAALLKARHILRIEAFIGKDGRCWWRLPPPYSPRVPVAQYDQYIDATAESVDGVFALLEQLVGENGTPVQSRLKQQTRGEP